MTLADKIVVLRAGYIEQVGSPLHLYKDPDNRFVAGFIGSPAMNFVSGKVTGAGVEVAALGGQVVPANVALPSAGSDVIVGLRPQILELTAAATAKVDIIEHLGGISYAYLDTPSGERIVVEARNADEVGPGAQVGVTFDPADAFFFDAKTEKRLR